MKTKASSIALAFAALALATTGTVQTAAQAPTAPAKPTNVTSYEIDVPGTKEWVDTNLDVRGGAKLRFTATGKITYPPDDSYAGKSRTLGTFGPDGLPRGFADLIHQYAVRDAGHGALIGRIGSDSYAQAFLVGASKEYVAPVAGRLFLGINQSMSEASTAQGSFHAKIEVLDEGLSTATNAGGPTETRVPSITPDLLSKIPRRVSDPNNKPGDMVNVLIVGTQDEMVQAFTTAEWVKVDAKVGNTALNAVIDSLEKKDYLTMPMSTLFLFGRAQDYGFAHAEPVRVAMSRNHLRVWKSPYEVEGRPLWCVAATHDIGFERDQRNNGLTHKIDPAIDGEREYVNGTLSATGLVVQRDHVTPANPLTTAKTATGGEFHSDGRILVLVLKHTASKSN
jgi:LssY C-terminus